MGRRRKFTVDRELGLLLVAALGMVLAAALVALGRSVAATGPFLTLSIAAISRMAPPKGTDAANPTPPAPDAARGESEANPLDPLEV